MATKISDKALLKIIKEYMNADRICEKTDITLKTLQTRVAKLTYTNRLENPSAIKGLYKPHPKIVRFSQNSIIIPKTRIEDSIFHPGDQFEITFDKKRIVLNKIDRQQA
ncbi:MAG: hypothetical protein LJE94_09285 [Deltaproteobacteria bacterium]|nr:hypothetical protein [Deltaproteobacteria bacterium]